MNKPSWQYPGTRAIDLKKTYNETCDVSGNERSKDEPRFERSAPRERSETAAAHEDREAASAANVMKESAAAKLQNEPPEKESAAAKDKGSLSSESTR